MTIYKLLSIQKSSCPIVRPSASLSAGSNLLSLITPIFTLSLKSWLLFHPIVSILQITEISNVLGVRESNNKILFKLNKCQQFFLTTYPWGMFFFFFEKLAESLSSTWQTEHWDTLSYRCSSSGSCTASFCEALGSFPKAGRGLAPCQSVLSDK